MKDYTTNGRIAIEPLDTFDLKEGIIGIIRVQNAYHIVTIVEKRENNWYAGGDYEGIVKPGDLARFIVVTDTTSYPITYFDWNKIIQQDLINKDFVPVIVKPMTFAKGHYHKTCENCGKHFVGHKKQFYCKSCCYTYSIAHIHPDVLNKKQIFSREDLESVAHHSYKLGKDGVVKSEFKIWLKGKINHDN